MKFVIINDTKEDFIPTIGTKDDGTILINIKRVRNKNKPYLTKYEFDKLVNKYKGIGWTKVIYLKNRTEGYYDWTPRRWFLKPFWRILYKLSKYRYFGR